MNAFLYNLTRIQMTCLFYETLVEIWFKKYLIYIKTIKI